MKTSLVLILLLSASAFSQVLSNKKTDEKIVFQFSSNKLDIYHVDSDNYETQVNSLEASQDGGQEVYSSNDIYSYESVDYLLERNNEPFRNPHKIQKLFSYSSLGILDICNALFISMDEGAVYDRSFFGGISRLIGTVIAMPICMASAVPGAVVVTTAAAGETGVHGAKYLFNKEAIALRKLDKIFKGKNAAASDRVFRKILKDLEEL